MAAPRPEEWREAVSVSPTLAADEAVLDHVLGRFLDKYLVAVLSARGPGAEERAWEGFYFWLVFPATDRKPFEAPTAEADAVIGRLKGLVSRLREAYPEG
jgi:hypothetical protein